MPTEAGNRRRMASAKPAFPTGGEFYGHTPGPPEGMGMNRQARPLFFRTGEDRGENEREKAIRVRTPFKRTPAFRKSGKTHTSSWFVKMSGPSFVMAMVCSYWAEYFPSIVRAVHPLSSIFDR